MNPVLRVERLHKVYDQRPAVDHLDLEVHSGEILGLIGPNGAGKTTTLECILGLRQPDGGKVWIKEVDALAEPIRCRQNVGAVLQSSSLPDSITPQQALRLFAAFYPHRCSVPSTLDRFGLSPQANAPYRTLSGGQKQRLALALAFIHHPRLLILDEPTAGLDPTLRRELMTLIEQARADGAAVLLSTHLLDEAARQCNRIAILDAGTIVVQGTPQTLLQTIPHQHRIQFSTDRPLDKAILTAFPCIQNIATMDCRYTLETSGLTALLSQLTQRLAHERIEIKSLTEEHPDLDSVYFHHIGEQTRHKEGQER